MRLDRRTFVKGAGVAAGAALTPGTAAGLIDDGIDTDGGLQEVIAEDGESTVPIPDTEDTNAVVGQEQPDL